MADEEKTFTLDSFQKAAEKKYGTKMVVAISGSKKTELRSPFRLNDEKRERALTVMDELNNVSNEDGDNASTVNKQVPYLRELLTAVGDDNTPELLDAINDDLGTLLEIFEAYQEEVKLGEAPASPES